MRFQTVAVLAFLSVSMTTAAATRAEEAPTSTAGEAVPAEGTAPEDGETTAEGESTEPAASAQAAPLAEETMGAGGETPGLQISGELKQRGEARRHNDFGEGQLEDPRFVGQLIRLKLTGAAGDFGYTVEFSDGREFGAERSTGTAQATSLLQGYLELGQRVKVRLGRQEITLGRKRLIGASGWAYRGHAAYDGVRAQAEIGSSAFDAFLVKVAEGGTTARDDTGLAAFSYSWKGSRVWQPGLYVLYSREDALDGWVGATDMPIGGTLGTFDLTPGLRLDYEVIFQGGTRRGLKHRASLYHASLKYTEPGEKRYWLAVEYNLASGDDDPTDDVSRTFDKLYSINHGKYGYIDYQDPRNMRNLRLTLGGKLAARLGAQIDYHRFSLDQAKDRWYSRRAATSLHDPTGAAGTDVGSEIDATLEIEVREEVGLELGYSRFFSGDFVETLLGGPVPEPDFGYIQLRVRF